MQVSKEYGFTEVSPHDDQRVRYRVSIQKDVATPSTTKYL